MSLFEQYKTSMVKSILAAAPEQFTAGQQNADDTAEAGVKPGQYNQQYQQKVVDAVEDKVDLLFGPIAKMMITKWKTISTEITNELKTQAKPEVKPAQTSGTKPATVPGTTA